MYRPLCAPRQVGGTALSISYRRDIDGLRCLAIVPVVLYHAAVPVFASGYTGVDNFFVISGFLIGSILDRDIRAKRFDIWSFWRRRILRLLPALLVMIVIVQLLAAFVVTGREMKVSSISALCAIGGFSNLYFWWSTNYFASSLSYSPYLMTWSLGVEAQYYLIAPLIMIFTSKNRPLNAIFILCFISFLSILLCFFTASAETTFAFYMLPTRLWELSLGAALGLMHLHFPAWQHRLPADLVASAGIGLLIFATLAVSKMQYPGVATFAPVVGTLALLSSEGSWINRHMLQWRPLVSVGRYSYSWYLWHMPLLEIMRLITLDRPHPAAVCIVLLISMVIAAISSTLVERRFRPSAGSDAQIPAGYHLAAGGICLALIMSVLARGFPQRLPKLARVADIAASKGRLLPCLAPYGSSRPIQSKYCSPPASRSQTGVALLGDSHAAALGDIIEHKVRPNGHYLIQIEKAACEPLLGYDKRDNNWPTHSRDCRKFNDAAFQKIAHDHRIERVILTAFWSASTIRIARENQIARGSARNGATQSDELRRALIRTVQRYRQAGKNVTIIGDVPLFRFNPAQAAMNDIVPLRALLNHVMAQPSAQRRGYGPPELLRSSTASDRALADALKAVPGTRYLSLRVGLCDAMGCRYAAPDGAPYYIDYHHLSQAGAEAALRRVQL